MTYTLQNVANTSISSNVVTKIAGGSAWNARAISLEHYANVRLTWSHMNGFDAIVGLAKNPITADGYSDIDFAFYTSSNNISYIPVESGTNVPPFRSDGPANSIYVIQISNGVVTYYRNNIVIHSHAIAPGGTYYAVLEVLQQGGPYAISDFVEITGVKASEAKVFSLLNIATPRVLASEDRVHSIINFPSQRERVSQVQLLSTVKSTGPMYVSEARVMAVVKGRTANPHIRAWTATLDGHDFYFLRLGDDETLVYDVTSDQWVTWDSAQSGAWRPNVGANWIGAQAAAHQYGTDIVAGDDTFGLLWFLDPNLPYDETPDISRQTTQYAFWRVVTGQIVARGREAIPCFAVFLDGDNYGLTATDIAPGVMLEISGDQGRTFMNAGTLDTPNSRTPGTYEWLSLGQIETPGRIFRITDNGVFARIDSLEMNDDAG